MCSECQKKLFKSNNIIINDEENTYPIGSERFKEMLRSTTNSKNVDKNDRN